MKSKIGIFCLCMLGALLLNSCGENAGESSALNRQLPAQASGVSETLPASEDEKTIQDSQGVVGVDEVLGAQEPDELGLVDEMPEVELILEAEIPPATYVDENGNVLPIPEVEEEFDDGNDFPENY